MEDLTEVIDGLEQDKITITKACKQKIMEYDKENSRLEDELDALACDFDEATLQLEDQTKEGKNLFDSKFAKT